MKTFRALIPAAFALLSSASAFAAAGGAIDQLQQSFATPPDSARPMVRWWWYGPAVVKPQLEKEMRLMKEGGYGGFEVQPTYPLALDGQYPGLVNLKFLSPEFFDMIGFTAAKAKEIGLRFDLTLGSGWPYGGPMFSREEAVQSIRQAAPVAVTPGQASVSPPADAGGRRGGGANATVPNPVIAALLGPIANPAPGASAYVPLKVVNGAAQLPADLQGATQVTFYMYAQANLMQVKRPAYGAEGFIVDHYAPGPIAKFIKEIAEPSLLACGPNTPYSIFCDSLEVAGEGWTPNFLAEFKQRRGYDLAPLLPALFDPNFPKSAEIRGDYGRTVIEVFNDNFVKTFTKLAHDHNTRFRIQAYGTPPTNLLTYADADIDEGENDNWRAFSGTRWAASASHLLGRPMASSEAFTWLNSPVFMAAPLDMKAESNMQFLNGVNQLLCHGWPYTAPGVEYPGWRFYAAAVFNDKNPWWIAMPDINNYLGRTSHLLREGQPANDVALYLPEEDGYTTLTPTSLQAISSSGGSVGQRVANVVPQLVGSGFNLDFVDDGILALRGKVDGPALAFGDVKYKVLVLPNVTRIPLATYQKIEAFANNGGILFAVGGTPSQAPGYLATEADHKAIQDISARLFTGPNAKGAVVAVDQLSPALYAKMRPDVAFSTSQSTVGFIHRHTPAGEVYFLANTSNQPFSDTVIFRVNGLNPEWWDATTGTVTPLKIAQAYSTGTAVKVDLPSYGAGFVVFTNRQLPAPSIAAAPAPIDLSRDWDVTFKNASTEPDPAPKHFAALTDWTADPATQYFSGTASYEKTVDVPAAMLQGGLKQFIDFGDGQPANIQGPRPHANYQPPVGDAAVVYVNGQRAGAAWCPPYRVNITGLLKPGANQIRIVAANRAANYMADQQKHPLPDLAALRADPRLGGNRFDPQDMTYIRTMPSGILGQVHLAAAAN